MSDHNRICIAIDGYAGTGKTTIGRQLAIDFGYHFLSAGSLYRALTVYCLNENVDIYKKDEILTAFEDVSLQVKYKNSNPYILINKKIVNQKFLGDEKVSSATPYVAKHLEVRERVVNLQRSIAKEYDVVFEGRDTGTNVVPYAQLKLFFTGNPEVCAQRRYNSIKNTDTTIPYESVLQNITKRNVEDVMRPICPLKKAEDAIVVDTSNKTKEETMKLVRRKVRETFYPLKDTKTEECLLY